MAVLSERYGSACLVAILAALLTGAIVGFINGFFVAVVRVPSFIVTLAASIWLFRTSAQSASRTKYAHHQQ